MDPTSVLRSLEPAADDLQVLTGDRGWLVARKDLVAELLRAGLGPDDAPRLTRSDLTGKRPLEEVRAAGEALVVRRYHHGGLLRWATGERFGDPTRPFLELVLQRRLAARGVLTPEVVAARAARARPWGWRLAVVTRRVEGALDLGHAFARQARGELPLAAWRRLVGETGRVVARLHACGFLHADLTPRNLLVEEHTLARGAPRVWVIDLDRSRFVEPLTTGQAHGNLRRLARHLQRMQRERGLALRRTDAARFLRGWQPRRDARHAAWRAIAALDVQRPGVHALGWWLERRLGRGRSGAEDALGDGSAAPRPPR